MAPNPLTAQINKIKSKLAQAPPVFDYGESPPPNAPYHFNLIKVEPPPPLDNEHPSVNDVRDRMRAEMAAYLRNPEPDHMLLVRATPGVGKTTAAVWAALEMAKLGKRVQYAGPRHAFFNDIMQAVDRWGGGMELLWEWLPRQDGDEGRIQHGSKRRTCQHVDAINTWMRKGYKGMDFCSGVCGWDYVNDACEYHAQKGRKEPIIFCQHAHISLGHPIQFGVTIGDENPMGAFTHVRTVKAKDVIGECPYGDFYQVLDAVKGLTEQEPREGPTMLQALSVQSGFSLSELTEICQTSSMPLDATPQGMKPPRTPDDALNAPVWYTPDLVFLLLRELEAANEGRAQIARIRTGYGQLDMYMRRSATDRLPAHVIWLDATANERIYSSLLGRKVKLVKAEPELKGRVFQVWNRANGKGSLLEKIEGEKKLKVTDKAQHASQLIERIIETREYQAPAVISFKDLAPTWEFTRRVEKGHFYAARGSNAFEDCDAIFIVGAPLPSLAAMKRTAGILFFERDAAFNEHWSRQNVRYSYTDENGDGWAYPIGNFWADTDLATVVTAYREEEIVHAAHRVRPVFQETDVWLLTNIPIDDLPPTKLFGMGEILGAPDGAHAFKFSAFVATVEQWEDNVITGKMIAERCDISLPTAYKYLRLLAERDGWELAVVRTGKRGPKSEGVKRREK